MFCLPLVRRWAIRLYRMLVRFALAVLAGVVANAIWQALTG